SGVYLSPCPSDFTLVRTIGNVTLNPIQTELVEVITEDDITLNSGTDLGSNSRTRIFLVGECHRTHVRFLTMFIHGL
mgnify:CR=1